MKDQTPAYVGYFGFGSLVNRHTLRTSFVDVIPATLKGWRRHWQDRSIGFASEIALLSIHRDPSTELKGVLVIDRLENLAAVDEREEGYTRHLLTPEDLIVADPSNLPEQLYVYVANQGADVPQPGKLLQSYLDAVLQGFLIEHGPEGVAHFMDTTVGFERGIVEDRLQPFYPRSVQLSEDEIILFDNQIARARKNATNAK